MTENVFLGSGENPVHVLKFDLFRFCYHLKVYFKLLSNMSIIHIFIIFFSELVHIKSYDYLKSADQLDLLGCNFEENLFKDQDSN